MKYAEYFFHFYLSAAEPNLGGGVAATDDSDDTPSTEVDSGLMQSPSSSKRVRLTSSMAKREMITYLEKKNENANQQHENELALRKEEMELNK